MKISVHSDLHLEGNRLPDGFGSNSKDVDVLILAGDIGVSDIAFSLYKIDEEYLETLKIIYVPGNHEYYGFDFNERNDYLRKVCDNLDIHFLEPGKSVVLGEYVFVGSTCFSEMENSTVDERIEVGYCISDFRLIKNGEKRWTVDDMVARAKEEKRSLEAMFHKHEGKKVVVCSHFPPLMEVANPIFPTNALTKYFHNDWSDLLIKHSPVAWIYGHTHFNGGPKEFCNTKLIRNQRGYNKEASNYQYDPQHIVEI